jgi:hypothetical protein
MTAKDHNKLLSIFHLIQGGLQAFGGIVIGLVYGIMGMAFAANAHRPEEQMMGTIFIVLAFVFAPLALIFAGINLTAGYKMLKEKPGARTWAIIASIVCPAFRSARLWALTVCGSPSAKKANNFIWAADSSNRSSTRRSIISSLTRSSSKSSTRRRRTTGVN